MAVKLDIDMREYVDLEAVYRAAGPKAPGAIKRALSRTIRMARTQMVRVLVKQTGLKRGVLVRALQVRAAGFGGLSAAVRSRGGDIRLKFFAPRETRKGVTARGPGGKRKLFAGAFMKGGRFPNRVAFRNGMAGGVFRRAGSGRFPVKQVRSGIFIPQEMVRDASAAAFLDTAKRVFPARLAHEFSRVLSK